jgi:toxin ParE1/3/4
MKYRFFKTADAAQDEIWDYTCDKWGEDQAKKYINGLHKHIAEFADKKKPWKPLPQKLVVPSDLETKVYFSQYESHYIFFRELSDGKIGIMSILHEKMDMPVRLLHDLNKIKLHNK